MDIREEILKYLHERKGTFLLYLVLNTILLSLNILNPYINGRYINILIEDADYVNVYVYTNYIIIISIINIAIYYGLRTVQIRLTSYLQYRIENNYIDSIKKRKLVYLQRYESAYLVQKVCQSSAIVVAFGVYILEFFVKGIQVIALFGMLIFINSEICLFLAILLPIYVIVYFTIKKCIYQTNYELQNRNNELHNEINQQVEHVKFIKSNSKYAYFKLRLEKEYNKFIQTIFLNHKYTNLFLSISLIINKIALVIVFFVGGIKIIENRLDVGGFTIIMSYFISIMDSIKTFFVFANEYEKYSAAKKRLAEISEIPMEENGNVVHDDISSIQICNLSYKINEHVIITEFNYFFEKGMVYLLKGSNGSGKSTFVDMLLGTNSEYTGNILINGEDIRNIDMEKMREKCISVLLQEPYLFIATLQENICFDEADESEKIHLLAKTVVGNKFLDEKGLDYKLNEKASNLSGGEKQKISLLRTLYKEVPFLILDEPTSWLDIDSSIQLINYLMKIKQDKIILVISHEKSFDTIVDKIIDFD